MTRDGILRVLGDKLIKSKMFVRVLGLSPTIFALSLSGHGCISPWFWGASFLVKVGKAGGSLRQPFWHHERFT